MVRIVSNFVTGIKSYIKAGELIFSSTMWLAFSVPILLSLGIFWGGEALIDSLKAFDFNTIDEGNGQIYLTVGIKSIFVYITVYMNKYMVLALLAPLLAALSVRTEFLLTGNKYKTSFKLYLEDVKRALIISFRNMGMQILFMVGFLLITFIYQLPGIVYDVFYFVVAFYFYGFSFMDYASERRRLTVKESVKFTRRHVGAAFALGGIYGGAFHIPYAGVVLAPIFGVVAGTIVVHELVDLSKNEHAIRPGEEGNVRIAEEADESEGEGNE